MELKEGEKHDDPQVKSNSINDTIHKVKVLTPYSFTIGDTRKFGPYKNNGIARQLKTKVELKFKSFEQAVLGSLDDMPLDGNLAVADFEKMQHSQISHICYSALDKFRIDHKRTPKPWDLADAKLFVNSAIKLAQDNKMEDDDLKHDSQTVKLFYLFAFQCQGTFSPLCAFMGGLVSQEIIKAIT